MLLFKEAFLCVQVFALFQFGLLMNQNSYLRRKIGEHLENYVIAIEYAHSEIECSLYCARNQACVSVNYNIGGADQGLCELNNATIPEKQGVTNVNFVYLEIVNRDCQEPGQIFSPETKRCESVPPIPILTSCKEILSNKASSPNGAYTLQSDNSAPPYKVYCHMTDIPACGSGGWTLVLKVDGNKPTFHYHSPYWTNKESYAVENGLEGLTEKESKLASYWNTPFKKICLGMTVNGDRRWMMLDYEATSLHTLIADGQYRPTNISLNSFKSLISSFSLQPNCNRQGFNNNLQNPSGPQYTFIRFGLLANNENDCNTCDSWIGFGAKFRGCGTHVLMACGNRAVCATNTGNVNITAFGYILVQ